MIHKVVCWCSFCLVHLLLECVLSHRAVNTALWCNFLVFSLKFGVWISTSSHVMLAELVHSVTDFANQVWLCFAMGVNVYTFPVYFMTGTENLWPYCLSNFRLFLHMVWAAQDVPRMLYTRMYHQLFWKELSLFDNSFSLLFHEREPLLFSEVKYHGLRIRQSLLLVIAPILC